MIAQILLPLLTLVAQPDAAAPARARVPPDVPMSGLLELTRQGEVALLPVHHKQPFNALLVTRSPQACETIAHDMLEVETWNKRWNIKDAVVMERTPTSVRYEIELGITMAPRIPGLIEHPDANHVVFNDVKTGAQFIWSLDPIANGAGEGCAMRYSLLETPGKASGWAAVVKAVEPSMLDAANFAAALSSARGFARPEEARSTVSASGESAFATLAAHGTALRLRREQNKFPVIIVRRVVDKPVDDVAWAIRDKRRYEDKIELMRDVEDGGRTTSYTVGAFGGRVSFDTIAVESGDLHTPGGLTLTESVAGGDIVGGQWVWTVRPVPGGTDIELTWNVDVAEGSAVMRTLAKTDPVARESLALHMALSLIGDLVGGKPLGMRALAQAP